MQARPLVRLLIAMGRGKIQVCYCQIESQFAKQSGLDGWPGLKGLFGLHNYTRQSMKYQLFNIPAKATTTHRRMREARHRGQQWCPVHLGRVRTRSRRRTGTACTPAPTMSDVSSWCALSTSAQHSIQPSYFEVEDTNNACTVNDFISLTHGHMCCMYHMSYN